MKPLAETIHSWNRRCTARVILFLALAPVCYALAWWFFKSVLTSLGFGEYPTGRRANRMLQDLLGWHPPSWLPAVLTCGLLVLITIAGIQRWRRNACHLSPEDSLLPLQLDWISAGGIADSHFSSHVNALPCLLSEIFLAGPLSILKAIAALRSKIPVTAAAVEELAQIRSEIAAAGKWTSALPWAAHTIQLVQLHQLREIELSLRQARVRICEPSGASDTAG